MSNFLTRRILGDARDYEPGETVLDRRGDTYRVLGRTTKGQLHVRNHRYSSLTRLFWPCQVSVLEESEK